MFQTGNTHAKCLRRQTELHWCSSQPYTNHIAQTQIQTQNSMPMSFFSMLNSKSQLHTIQYSTVWHTNTKRIRFPSAMLQRTMKSVYVIFVPLFRVQCVAFGCNILLGCTWICTLCEKERMNLPWKQTNNLVVLLLLGYLFAYDCKFNTVWVKCVDWFRCNSVKFHHEHRYFYTPTTYF